MPSKKKTGPNTKGKPGRKRFVIDYDQVRRLASIHCTDDEIAAVLGCAVRTLTRVQKYKDVRDAAKQEGKASLRRMQYLKAKDGNITMLIWLGKQLLGQTDKQHLDHSSSDGSMATKTEDPIDYSQLSTDTLRDILKASKPGSDEG